MGRDELAGDGETKAGTAGFGRALEGDEQVIAGAGGKAWAIVGNADDVAVGSGTEARGDARIDDEVGPK